MTQALQWDLTHAKAILLMATAQCGLTNPKARISCDSLLWAEP